MMQNGSLWKSWKWPDRAVIGAVCVLLLSVVAVSLFAWTLEAYEQRADVSGVTDKSIKRIEGENWTLDSGELIFRSGSIEMLRLSTEQRLVLTHTLSAREKAAAEILVGERLRRPFALVNGNGIKTETTLTPDQIATEMAAWHAELISTALRPYLDRLDAEETRDAANEIRELSAEECATLNGTRKKAGKPALRRCGKGGGR